VRRKLAEVLQRDLTEAGLRVRVSADELDPQMGAWRTDHRLDVMRWDGRIEIDYGTGWRWIPIGSWDTMTDCCRGVVLVASDFTLEVGAL
jgi:hypothetical protein